MELEWVDPSGTVKIACGCRARGNKGRKIETEVDCKGSFETCCEEACGKAGRYVWDGQPSRIVYRPEFAKCNGAADIASQNYVPGIGTYFSRYVFAWETPHPTDPYDLALTRGKIVIGGAGVGTLAIIGGVKDGVVGGTGWVLRGAWYYDSHYGRSMMYWGARNPNAAIEIGGGLGGAVGLGTSPDVSGGVTRVGQELLENADDMMIRLYRGIGPEELDDVLREGHYGFNRSGSGKYFFHTEDDLRKFAAEGDNQFMRALTEVEVPAAVVREGVPVNAFGEGPAVFFTDEQLLEMYDGMQLPKILDSNCIPILGQGKQ
jgi:hypothetical protein